MKIIEVTESADIKSKKQFFLNNGFTLYELDSPKSIEDFYTKIISLIPIGIPLSGQVHWDAFLDSAWEGITEENLFKTCIIWYNPNLIIEKNLIDFITIISNLIDLSRLLTTENIEFQFLVVLVV